MIGKTIKSPARRHAAPQLLSVEAGRNLELSRMVEQEIIPRLMLMHSALPAQPMTIVSPVQLTNEHIDKLALLAAEGGADDATNYVRDLVEAGASLEHVFLDLLAPSAKLLGQHWEDDVYDFSQVTLGLWRLQQALHEHGSRFNLVGKVSQCKGNSALLAAVPGTQHTFGVSMVAEFFSAGGWDVSCEPQATWAGLHKTMSSEWFDMFGLSISKSESILECACGILEMRRVSVNPDVLILVGGPLASLVADLPQLCGADDMAVDACSALAMANLRMATGNVAQRLQG